MNGEEDAGRLPQGNWHQLHWQQVVQMLQTDLSQGLSQAEVARRLQQYGANELVESPPKSIWWMLWEQFTATTVLVLMAAALISGVLGDYKDMTAILAIVFFNGLLGASQEYKAGQEFAALKQLAVPKATVFRSGQWQEVLARDLVPGDILRLEDGDHAPADVRLLECSNLWVQESTFTGESEPVQKQVNQIEGERVPLGDRRNLVYMGTVVTYGRGRAVVTATGMNTELGKTAHTLQTVEAEPTPLQRRLDQLGRRLAISALGLVGLIFLLGQLHGEDLHLMFLTAVSLAVAVIPEGLPAVVTIALSLGARRMLKRQALIRKLPAVETLGSVTTICSDKTGTLTENRMTVTVLALAGQQIELKEPLVQINAFLTGEPSSLMWQDDSSLDPAIALLMTGSALCNDILFPDQAKLSSLQVLGDPTEVALVVAAARLGLQKPLLEKSLPRMADAPFDSDRRRMTTIHRLQPLEQSQADHRNKPLSFLSAQSDTQPYIAFTKGAVANLLEVCSRVWYVDQCVVLDHSWLNRIQAANDQMARTGTRVLGIAFRLLDSLPPPGQEADIEQDLVFIGLIGMLDPARPEAVKAVQTCQKAGIRPVMITGDHPLMAVHIAEEMGIASDGQVLTGRELDQMSLSQLEQRVEVVSVYARVSPQQKLKIVQALQNRGHIVAMTGDGVNDAPALSKADIGVAMGLAGTDVAKEAADMVLLNDNFATIVAAVEEGRTIYDNIRKFIRYSLTGNTSGVVIMLIAPVLGMPLPLLPLQILWINLLADGLLALALSVEPAEHNTMLRPPYPPNESVFSRGIGRDIIWVSILMGLTFLLMGYQLEANGWFHWQTMLFSMLAFSRISLALAMRSQSDLLIRLGLFSNRPMLMAVVLTFVLQLAVIYLPWLQDTFRTQPLSLAELGLCLGISTIGFWAVELEKLMMQRWLILGSHFGLKRS